MSDDVAAGDGTHQPDEPKQNHTKNAYTAEHQKQQNASVDPTVAYDEHQTDWTQKPAKHADLNGDHVAECPRAMY